MDTREKGKERKRLACFQWCRSLRSNCAYRSVLLSRQRSQCPLPLRLFGRGRVVRRGSARCTQCLRASRSTSLYPAARCSRGPYIIIANRRLISNRVANSPATLVLHQVQLSAALQPDRDLWFFFDFFHAGGANHTGGTQTRSRSPILRRPAVGVRPCFLPSRDTSSWETYSSTFFFFSFAGGRRKTETSAEKKRNAPAGEPFAPFGLSPETSLRIRYR